MIYLTTDQMDNGVYFDLRKSEPRRRGGCIEHLYYGLLGNGVIEMPITVKSWKDCIDVVFGKDDLFQFVDERTIRQLLGEAVRELAS